MGAWFQKISKQPVFWDSEGKEGFFDLEIQRHRGTYDWNSGGTGGGREVLEETNKSVKAQIN